MLNAVIDLDLSFSENKRSLKKKKKGKKAPAALDVIKKGVPLHEHAIWPQGILVLFTPGLFLGNAELLLSLLSSARYAVY